MALALAGVGAWFLFPERSRQILPDAVAAFIGLPQPDGNGSGDTPSMQAVAVRTAVATKGNLPRRFETVGEVIAADSVIVASEIARRVAEVLVEDGERLEAGDTVLRFHNTSEEIAVAAAEARLDEAAAELRRATQLAAKDYAPESRIESARAVTQAAELDLESAQAALDDLTIRAPFSGTVGFIDVTAGAYLGPGDPIVRLVSDHLRLRLTVPVEIADAVTDPEQVEIDDGERSCGSARSLVFAPVNDPASRTREIEAALPEACSARPGAFLTVAIRLPSDESGVIVPHGSVLRQGFEAAVFRIVQREGREVAVRTPVELGTFQGDRVEVLGGLDDGDRIVASGLQKVSDGVPVRILEASDQ